MLEISKMSLKIESAKQACTFMTNPQQFEEYIRINYIQGGQLIEDLCSEMFMKEAPTSVSESFQSITEGLAVL